MNESIINQNQSDPIKKATAEMIQNIISMSMHNENLDQRQIEDHLWMFQQQIHRSSVEDIQI